MFGFCNNKKAISMIDLYLVNDKECFNSQYAHIKKCLSSKIGTSKTGLLYKEQEGKMIIYLYKFDGLHMIPDICKCFIIL